jgi:hypothetical protein
MNFSALNIFNNMQQQSRAPSGPGEDQPVDPWRRILENLQKRVKTAGEKEMQQLESQRF